jgi:hypothetical protein
VTGVFGGQAVRSVTRAVTPRNCREDLIGPDEVDRGASENFDAVIRKVYGQNPGRGVSVNHFIVGAKVQLAYGAAIAPSLSLCPTRL